VSIATAATGQALAQTVPPKPTENDTEDTIRTNTDLLLFVARVRDKRGRAVPGLTEKHLSLEDKDRVISGLYFLSGVDRVALLFALDLSGSIRDVISQQRDAALSLFGRFGNRSSVAVLHFAETASLVMPFNNDATATGEAFIFQPQTNRLTAIFDAAAKGVSAFDSLPRVRSERRIVILISDGLDNASTIKPKTVIEEANEKHVSFYVIHLPLFEPGEHGLVVRRPSSGFKDLAKETGGKYFLVTGPDPLAGGPTDLKPIFHAIEEDLRSQYLLGFYIAESSRDGRKHALSLSLIPDGIEYSVGSRGYSRRQKFAINLPASQPNR
jgi:Ca-activated chloride channel family protein